MIRTFVKSLYNSLDTHALGERILEVLDTGPDLPLIVTFREAIRTALQKLKDARVNSGHNSQTDKQEAADATRDLCLRALFAFVEACTLRQNKQINGTAKEVWKHLEKFDRSMYRWGYQAQSAEMEVLFAALDKLEDQLAVIGAADWYSELKESEVAFHEIFSDKIQEETDKSKLVPTHEAREEVKDQLVGLTQILNGMESAGLDGIADLNAEIDTIIGAFEGPARARLARKKNNAEDEDDDEGEVDIEEAPYTGV